MEGYRGFIADLLSGLINDRAPPVRIVDQVILVLTDLANHTTPVSKQFSGKIRNKISQFGNRYFRSVYANIVSLTIFSVYQDLVITNDCIRDVAECAGWRTVRIHHDTFPASTSRAKSGNIGDQ